MCAKDGCSALSMVATDLPAIAILDINLPGIDGFTLADNITGIALCPLPIFYLSASKSETVLNHPSLQLAAAFYRKPFDAKNMVSDVSAILAKM